MFYQLVAEAILILHLAFGVFAVLGGFMHITYPRVVWLHVPAVIWGTLVNLMGWVCPLTPLENWFRGLAGGSGYEGDFIEHYLMPVVYSEEHMGVPGVTLGVCLAIWTLVVYTWVWSRRRDG